MPTRHCQRHLLFDVVGDHVVRTIHFPFRTVARRPRWKPLLA
jgi:hypothetical protein